MVSWDTCMLSSSGYWVFSQPEICFGDQSSISLLATMSRNFRWMKAGSAWAARPTARFRYPLDWRDTPDGRHDVQLPGSRSIPLALNVWQSHGTTNREQLQISSRSRNTARGAPSAVLPEQSHPDAPRHHEWSYGPCQSAPRSTQLPAAFQRRHMSHFCSAESPNRLPRLINTTFESSFIPDGVASTVYPG